MTGQLASPATWPPQPERSTPDAGPAGCPAESGAHGARLAARAVAGIMLCLCHVRMPGTQLVTPDAASNGPQGSDMLQGTVLLRGWTVSDASPASRNSPSTSSRKWSGARAPDVVHVAPAITYTLLVLPVNYAALLAWRDMPSPGVVTAPALAGAHNPSCETP